MQPTLKIKKLSPDAKIPTYNHSNDAGLDLYAAEAITLQPGQRAAVKSGIALAIPDGHVGLIWDKSGIGIKGGIKTLGGVVDAGYRGEILIGVVNLSQEQYTLEIGHKVAQMLVQKVEHADIIETDMLDETERGEKGFGSSGK